MNTELLLVHNISSSNKHGKSAKDYRFTDLVKNWTWQKSASSHARINYNKLGKIAKHVNNLPGTFYSKSRARLTQARMLHKCKKDTDG